MWVSMSLQLVPWKGQKIFGRSSVGIVLWHTLLFCPLTLYLGIYIRSTNSFVLRLEKDIERVYYYADWDPCSLASLYSIILERISFFRIMKWWAMHKYKTKLGRYGTSYTKNCFAYVNLNSIVKVGLFSFLVIRQWTTMDWNNLLPNRFGHMWMN